MKVVSLRFTGSALIIDDNVSPANKIRRVFSPMNGPLGKCCSPNIITYKIVFLNQKSKNNDTTDSTGTSFRCLETKEF